MYQSETPKVTVLMPVYNGEEYIREAIDSILCQTFADFEFLVIDDGSTDNSLEIINSYQDPRIRLVQNFTNQGLPYSLNYGILLSRGKYIARMDCDDISSPNRLIKQVEFLDKNPDIGILGSYFVLMTKENKKFYIKTAPISDLEIRYKCLFETPFGHPTVMYRREIFEKNSLNYETELNPVEDYKLWTQIIDYTKGANIKDPLVYYRLHNQSISHKYKNEQIENHILVSFTNIKKQLPELNVCKEDIDKVVKICIFNIKPHSIEDVEYFRILLVYIQISEAFIVKYITNSDKIILNKIKSRVAVNVLIKAAKNLPSKFLIKAIKKSFALTPNLIFYFFIFVFYKIRRYTF
jgi:glycosyltransferase involved in cell wall biosynthesis